MTKPVLIAKISAMLDEAEKTRGYGEIKIEYRSGRLTFLSKTEHTKLDETENRDYARQAYR